jgi:hypothetical protein
MLSNPELPTLYAASGEFWDTFHCRTEGCLSEAARKLPGAVGSHSKHLHEGFIKALLLLD